MDKNTLIENMKKTANIKPLKINVAGWGELYVKSLTVAEVQEQTEANESADIKDKRTLAIGAARIICDENGERVFNPDDNAHIELLQKQPWSLLSKVVTASSDFNALSEAGQEKAKKG